MEVIRTVLTVFFIIISVLLVIFVMIQNEDNNGMGGVFGGGQSTAFGAHSGSVLSKVTGVFVALFFVFAFSIAVLSRAGKSSAETAQAKGEAASKVVEEQASAESDETKEAESAGEATDAADAEEQNDTVTEIKNWRSQKAETESETAEAESETAETVGEE